jgi:DNA helicase HerA-like ATPase
MKEALGIAAPGSTREQIIIYSKDRINADYISTADEDKRYIFEVTMSETINERLQDTEIFRIMREDDDFSKYNVFKTSAHFIGAIKDGKITDDFFYITSPGTNIFGAEKEDIEIIYDINEKSGRIKIGTFFRQKDIPVYFDFKKLFSTHASILGRTGSGKTFFIRHLLQKLKTKYIVISPSDEYNSLVNINLFDSGEIPVDIEISKCKNMFDLNDSEFSYLKQYLKLNNENESIYSNDLSKKIISFYSQINQIKYQPSLFFYNNEKTIENYEVPRYVSSLCDKLSHINIKVNNNQEEYPDKFPIVFSTQELSEFAGNVAVHSLLSTILNLKKNEFKESNKKKDDILIILEEAHIFAPSVKTTKCKDIIVQIAREGRKYGLHLIILSQRPRYIDQTLLSQCGTNIIFNLPNPQDIEYVMEHSYFYNENSKNIVKNLKTGECLITSNARNIDVICNVQF